MALKVPDSPVTKTQIYSDLLGVDFSQDASLVDRRHSPDMLNMISDEGGSPVKRKGWHIIDDDNTKQYFKMLHFEYEGIDYYIAVYKKTGSNQYYARQFDPENGFVGEEQPLWSSLGFSFFMGNKLYLSSGNNIYAVTPNSGSVTIATITAKVPTVIIRRNPTTGGGDPYENVNLLTNRRAEQFYDNSQNGATQFRLAATADGSLPISGVPLVSNVVLKYLDSNGVWQIDTTADSFRRQLAGRDWEYFVTIDTGHPHPDPDNGADNIKIEYTFTTTTSAATSSMKKITKCTNHAFFSHGGLDQVFVTGNPDYPNYVWYSGMGDPTYFPDLNYMVVGSAGTKCMGFLNIGDNLAVVKETAEQDSAIFFIYETSITSKTVTTSTDTGSESESTQEYSYAIKRATGGVGAVSRNCFKILQDEPLFFSETGIHGLVSMNTTSEKVVRNRSAFLNKKLLAESNLENAISCVCNGYYYLFINDHVYILDSRHTFSDKRGNTSYSYESYYWENVPASCVCVANNIIYFGTSDGKLCRFKNSGSMTDYSDGSYYENGEYVDGDAIYARYATRQDDDDAPQFFKTMMKKGTMCTVAPFEKSSVDVYIMADGTPPTAYELYYDRNGNAIYDSNVPGIYLGTHYLNVDNIFPEIDFSRLLFDTRRAPRDYFFRKKKKKYIRLQITLENKELNEAFGVYNIVKTYTLTRYAK